MSLETVDPQLQNQNVPVLSGTARFLAEKLTVVTNPVWDGRIVALHKQDVDYATPEELGMPEEIPIGLQIERLGKRHGSHVRFYQAWQLGKSRRKDMIALLIAVLRYGTELEQVVASILLSRTGKTALPALSAIANDENPSVRRQVVWILGLIGDPENVEIAELLENALRDPSPYVRSYAATALGHVCCPHSIPALIDALADPADKVAWFAASALESFREQALEPLVAALDDEREAVRIGAAHTLGRLMYPEAIGALKKVLHDPSVVVSNVVLESLGWIRTAAAVNTLISLLGDKDSTVRLQVIVTLGWIRDKRAVEPLIHLIADEDEWVAYAAISALREIGDERAIAPLAKAAQDSANQRVQRAARHALNTMQANLNT
ncbi:MAG: HEAT repeat domain-containing protein [Anaerolineaceae bacterium]|nr:HEAT repeat domain-containing protein [Anaerolineaceae bacterium]